MARLDGTTARRGETALALWTFALFAELTATALFPGGALFGKALSAPQTQAFLAFGLVLGARLALAFRGKLERAGVAMGFVLLDVVGLSAIAVVAKASALSHFVALVALRGLSGGKRQGLVAGIAAVLATIALIGWALYHGYVFQRETEIDRLAALAVLVVAVVQASREAEEEKLAEPTLEGALSAGPLPDERPEPETADSDAAAERVPPGLAEAEVARSPEKAIETISSVETETPPEPELPRPRKRAPARNNDMRQAGLLCIGVRGFPKVFPAGAHEYHARLTRLVQKHGGRGEPLKGTESFLTHFGVEAPSATAAADALRALDELIAETDAWNTERRARGEKPLRFSFACAVANAAPGTATEKFDLSVVAESVNLATRMEKYNLKIHARALTTRQTLEMACAQGYQVTSYVRALLKQQMDGVSFPIDVVVLAEEEKDSVPEAA